jgi:hypothetical protein
VIRRQNIPYYFLYWWGHREIIDKKSGPLFFAVVLIMVPLAPLPPLRPEAQLIQTLLIPAFPYLLLFLLSVRASKKVRHSFFLLFRGWGGGGEAICTLLNQSRKKGNIYITYSPASKYMSVHILYCYRIDYTVNYMYELLS